MHKKGLSHLLEPSFRLYFIFLALFAAASAVMGQYHLALFEGVVVLVLLDVGVLKNRFLKRINKTH